MVNTSNTAMAGRTFWSSFGCSVTSTTYNASEWQ
uniref:Uncharacterized protein n=1 Tax=Anguilla anguilla TaxID=7936 RepID=A0A0E9QM30_ANGAN